MVTSQLIRNFSEASLVSLRTRSDETFGRMVVNLQRRRSSSILHRPGDHGERDDVARDADVAQRLEPVVGHEVAANGGRNRPDNLENHDISLVTWSK